jgi:hypothetical protein
LTRPKSSFPVSHPQGAGNWETGAEPLIANDLLFPGPLQRKTAPGKLKSLPPKAGSRRRNSLDRTVPPMAIQRRYQTSVAPTDDLIEALFQLLAVVGEEGATSSSVSRPARPITPEGEHG